MRIYLYKKPGDWRKIGAAGSSTKKKKKFRGRTQDLSPVSQAFGNLLWEPSLEFVARLAMIFTLFLWIRNEDDMGHKSFICVQSLI